MTAQGVFVLAWPIGLAVLMSACTTLPVEKVTGPVVTIDDIAAGIHEHIVEQSRASGGYFKVQHNKKELNLELVRVHLEYLSHLGDGVSFACVDLVGTDGPVYDVDFFMEGPPGAMAVTDTSVHKVNGQPLYTWEQRRNGTWRKVAVKKASRRLLGVINGSDEFEFIYRAELPEITGDARLWLPLAASDEFQRVQVKSINAPGQWRELEEDEHGNKVLFLNAGPADSGKTIEVRYRVKRFEKSEYALREPGAQKYLKPERLVPTNGTFRAIAQQVTGGKTREMARARALYDHVIEKMRYARYGSGWGVGDASYACDARSGNCSDFHAYFIALAREAGIPARFAIGAAIPSERNDGGIDGCHCWAEFFADGKWVPIDVSEADKNSSLADYYFGHHPANRFELSKGRDLIVEPQPASGPINFLGYPVMEMHGKTVKVRTEFQFRRPE
ncbi:MAG: transglutaminase domain-containing protein [Verrucomicrobiales bacterium]|nr:transglutaminase domain-containing protein [Verrucomicrobiales bacterium]